MSIEPGQSHIVLMRQAADVRLRNAVYHWTRIAAQNDPTCKARHKALRARGHGLPGHSVPWLTASLA